MNDGWMDFRTGIGDILLNFSALYFKLQYPKFVVWGERGQGTSWTTHQPRALNGCLNP